MNSIKIRPARADDAVSIAQIHYQALGTFHEFYAAFFANHPRHILPKSTALALNNPSQIFLVAVDISSDEAVGFIRYYSVNETSGEEQNVKQVEKIEDDPSIPTPSLFAPKEHLKGLWARFNERDDDVEACYTNAAKKQKHICK